MLAFEREGQSERETDTQREKERGGMEVESEKD
jgi:hypothetical protein